MTINDLRDAIIGCGNEVYFTYNGKKSGIEPEVENGVFTFEVWHGSKLKRYSDFNEVVTDLFFSGKTITELLNKVEFEFY